MNCLADLTASGVSVTIAGQEYCLLPLRLRDWAEAAQHLNQQRRPVLEVLRAWLPELNAAEQRQLLEIAYRDARDEDSPPLAEIEAWFQTAPGRVYQRWLMLRQKHPELSLDDVEELLRAAELEELAQIAQHAPDDGDLALDPSSPPPPVVAPRSAAESLGDACSSTSAESLASPPSKSPS